MTIAGLVMMISAFALITFLCIYGFYRLFTEKRK